MMKRKTTEELIVELAAAPAVEPFNPVRAALGMVGSVLLGLAIVWATVGWRADLAVSLLSPVTLAKLLLPLSLSVMALYFAAPALTPGCGQTTLANGCTCRSRHRSGPCRGRRTPK